MRTILLVVAALAQFGCAHARHASPPLTCDIGSPIAERDTLAFPPALAGTFTLTRDYPTRPGRAVDSTKLILATTTPEQRANARARTIGNLPRPWLSGRWIWSGQLRPDDAEVWDGTRTSCSQSEFTCGSWSVVLGCTNCFDGSPTYLYVHRVGDKGFAGEWVDYETGIGISVDKHGKRLPLPEGDFCALREAS